MMNKKKFLLWKIKIKDHQIQVLSECDDAFYPNIRKMLEILVTLSVGINFDSTTAERTFSGLRRIKTYLRHEIN